MSSYTLRLSLFIEPKPSIWQYIRPRKFNFQIRNPSLTKKLFLMSLLLLYWRQKAVAIIIRTSNCQILHLTEKKGLLSFDEIMVFCNYYLEPATMTFWLKKTFFLVGSDNSKVKTVFFICDIIHLLYLLFLSFSIRLTIENLRKYYTS